jgi:arylsulfatase A-like enzyme
MAAGGAAAAMMPSCSYNSESADSNDASKRPNIIFILADDLGYGDLGCYGQQKIKTPSLDRMAAEGMRFTQHYAGSTVCAPSRCALMAGLHTGHTYVRGNYLTDHVKFEGDLPIPSDTLTVAELLKKAGYATAIIGKWGLGGPGTTGVPNKQGFDYFFGYLDQIHAHSYYPGYLWRSEEKVELEGNRNGRRNTYSHDLITKEALEFVERNKQQPFFLYLAYTIPHAELAVPQDSLKQYEGKFPEEPFEGGGYRVQKTPKAAFAAMVSRMDRDIGQLFAKLKDLRIDENTVVLFSSDNGSDKEGGADPWFFNSTGPLRGLKRDLYEGGIRVPMLVRWPGEIKAGSVSEHISAFWDFLPTACGLAKVNPPDGIDGISYLPALLGKKQEQHKYLYWEFFSYNWSWQPGRSEQWRNRFESQAVRMGDWKAVRLNVYENPNAPMELYNLRSDIGEKFNIAEQHPEIVVKIQEYIKTARTASKYFPAPGKTQN